MKTAPDATFPLSVLSEVIQTFVGWSLAMIATMVLALGMGLWAGGGQFPGFVALSHAILLAIAVAIFHQPLLAAGCATLCIWVFEAVMEVESIGSRVGGLVTVFAIWAAVGFWMAYSLMPA